MSIFFNVVEFTTGTVSSSTCSPTQIFQLSSIGELTLINPLDYESGVTQYVCLFFIGTDLRTLSVNVVDDNDNVPYFTNPPNGLSWEEVWIKYSIHLNK